ncbi:preprotein translocase subunit SecG [Niabella hirudinis]|uniref:preprotein translocase subunit SecG n=1 Tax=Niabella hirudinis TaxID=1285929 RepID=UPI003EBF73DD
MLTTLFVILIILVCVILSFIVLIQNPKGGGLAGTFGGVSSQFMGVKQTNDVLEKGTWIFAAVIGVLCLFSTFFVSGTKAGGGATNGRLKDISTQPVQQAQPQAAPAVPFSNGVQQQPAQPAPKPGSGK